MKLWNLLQKLYDAVGHSIYSIATGGSTTTVVDSRRADSGDQTASFKGAAILIASAGAAAPEGEYGEIIEFDNQTGTFTLMSALGGTVAAGDRYGVLHARFPLHTMIEVINTGLQNLGYLWLVDDSTLVIAENTTEYTAPVLWKKGMIQEIERSRNDVVNNYMWTPVHKWRFIPSTAGATAKIEFGEQLEVGTKLRVWFWDTHPRVELFSSSIYEGIAPTLAQAAAVLEATKWLKNMQDGDDDLIRDLKRAEDNLSYQLRRHPIPLPEQKSKLMKVSKDR